MSFAEPYTGSPMTFSRTQSITTGKKNHQNDRKKLDSSGNPSLIVILSRFSVFAKVRKPSRINFLRIISRPKVFIFFLLHNTLSSRNSHLKNRILLCLFFSLNKFKFHYLPKGRRPNSIASVSAPYLTICTSVTIIFQSSL